MQDQEALEMMQRCAEEIRSLRRTIERLQAKAEAWDGLCAVLSLLPKPSQGAAPDLAWLLDKRSIELRRAMETSCVAPDAVAAEG
jgi:hypothetical protein